MAIRSRAMPESRSDDAEASLSPGEWAKVSEQRALVYGWLSTLYAAEIPRARLAAYLAGEAAPLLEGFSIMGFGAEARRLQAAIDALREVQDAHLELAADFAQLFLLDAHAGALPYASAHDTGEARLYGPAEARMRAFLARASLAIQDDFKEPADHLAVHLALMARIALEQAGAADVADAARDQAAFLRDALLPWLPSFAARSQRASPRFDLYPALAALLLALVEHDAGFLGDVAASSARGGPSPASCGSPSPRRRFG